MSYQAKLQQIRQTIIRNSQPVKGTLGDGSGNVHASTGYYWVRFPAGTDTNGVVTYTEALPISYGMVGAIIAREGVDVIVEVDNYDGELTITRMARDYPIRAGFDSKIVNGGETLTKFVDVPNFIRLMTRPVGSVSGAESTKITLREDPFFVDDALEWQTYAGTITAALKPDLAAYIPVADYHCLVCVFFDRFLNTYKITASTAQLLTTALDSTDYDECFAQLDHNEYTALVSLRLADAQTAIDKNDLIEDLRSWLAPPRVYGFPNPIPADKAIYIRSTHQEITYNLTVAGNLTVEGDMIVL